MKKCPICDKKFEDSMRFCQTDGTPLVDDAPAFDPYATIVARPEDVRAPAEPAEEPVVAAEPVPVEEPPVVEAPAEEIVLEPIAAEPPTPEPVAEPIAEPIAEPDEVLDLPEHADPLKTMYVSDAEMQAALGAVADEPHSEEPSQPEAPSVPDVSPPSFSEPIPPPSPFAVSESVPEPVAEPVPMETPTVEPTPFDEAPTMFQPPVSTPFDQPEPAPVAEWTPPPAPDASWQNKEIGSNTPFEPPPPGAGGPSQGLAVGSLICGILSCLCCLSVLTGPAAIIMGFIAKKHADENPSQFGGRGLAIGGMIAGAVGFLIGVVVIVLQVFFGVLGNLLR